MISKVIFSDTQTWFQIEKTNNILLLLLFEWKALKNVIINQIQSMVAMT